MNGKRKMVTQKVNPFDTETEPNFCNLNEKTRKDTFKWKKP